jgi:Ser/Thr protein kinase RdoA (MazF antagonist)
MADQTFPVTYSTLACDAIAHRVLTMYPLDAATSCQLWHRGLSDVYLIELPDTQYVLRVSHAHWRSKPEIDFELELLVFLETHHIPVASPLKTKTGELCVEIQAPEGKRYAALFRYAPGQIAQGDLDQHQGYMLGETVAKIHHVTTDFQSDAQRQPLTLDYLLDDSLAVIAPFLRDRATDLTYLIDLTDQIKSKLQTLPQEKPYWSICWGDPHSGNAHFTEDNQITLFDFDQCGYGWRAFEVAKFLQTALRAGMRKQTRDSFLEGYQTVQKLTPEEFSGLQSFTQTAHIWMWAISLTHAKIHNFSQLDPSYFSHRLAQLKLLNSPEWQLF